MRKVVYGGAISVDGYLAREDGSVDWLVWSEDSAKIMAEMWPRFDVMLMGRKTYDFADPDSGKYDAKKLYRGMRVIVFSQTLPERTTDFGLEIIRSDPAVVVRELKLQDGKDIMVMGGGHLANALFDAGLIDEIGFSIQPILLGSGIPTFRHMPHQLKLELTGCRRIANGCVYVTYSVINK